MRSIALILAFLITPFLVRAERLAIRNKTAYPFYVQMPASGTTDEKPPLIVFLHGRSLAGNNLERVQRYGVLYSIDKGNTELPALVAAPQSPGGWNPDKVIEVIDYMIEHYNADPERVYVCGMSMGAYGTLDVAGAYPDRIAAAVAICGGGSQKYACNLTKVPLWIQHGTADRAVPVSESKKITNAIKQCDANADITLTLIPGGTHGSVERLFHKEAIYQWMLQYKRPATTVVANEVTPTGQ